MAFLTFKPNCWKADIHNNMNTICNMQATYVGWLNITFFSSIYFLEKKPQCFEETPEIKAGRFQGPMSPLREWKYYLISLKESSCTNSSQQPTGIETSIIHHPCQKTIPVGKLAFICTSFYLRYITVVMSQTGLYSLILLQVILGCFWAFLNPQFYFITRCMHYWVKTIMPQIKDCHELRLALFYYCKVQKGHIYPNYLGINAPANDHVTQIKPTLHVYDITWLTGGSSFGRILKSKIENWWIASHRLGVSCCHKWGTSLGFFPQVTGIWSGRWAGRQSFWFTGR